MLTSCQTYYNPSGLVINLVSFTHSNAWTGMLLMHGLCFWSWLVARTHPSPPVLEPVPSKPWSCMRAYLTKTLPCSYLAPHFLQVGTWCSFSTGVQLLFERSSAAIWTGLISRCSELIVWLMDSSNLTSPHCQETNVMQICYTVETFIMLLPLAWIWQQPDFKAILL